MPSMPSDSPQQFPRLIQQRDTRRLALKKHRETVREFSAHVETNGNGTVPSTLKKMTESVKPALLDGSEDHIADGFAALRAQGVQRKVRLRELKHATVQCNYAQQRTKQN